MPRSSKIAKLKKKKSKCSVSKEQDSKSSLCFCCTNSMPETINQLQQQPLQTTR